VYIIHSAIVPLEKVLREVIECPARATRSFAVHAGILEPANGQDELCNRYYRLCAVVSV